MRRRAMLLTMVGMASTITACGAPTTAARVEATTQCRGPDALSARLISYLQVLVTGTDTATVTRRHAWEGGYRQPIVSLARAGSRLGCPSLEWLLVRRSTNWRGGFRALREGA